MSGLDKREGCVVYIVVIEACKGFTFAKESRSMQGMILHVVGLGNMQGMVLSAPCDFWIMECVCMLLCVGVACIN